MPDVQTVLSWTVYPTNGPVFVRHCSRLRRQMIHAPNRNNAERIDMGKYLIAWLLGVPALVLVVVYMLF